MKVIDLLNKIANGEEVPKVIKYSLYELTYDEDTQDYYNEPECTYSLFDEIHRNLNDEVQIIEDTPEDKKIQPITDEVWKVLKCDLIKKINEIIDKINGEF